MEYILILFYLALFSVLIYRLPFFRIEKPNQKFLVLALVLKVVFAISYGILHEKYYGRCDTFHFFDDGNIVFATLFENPIQYLRLVFGLNNISVSSDLQQVIEKMGYWGNNGSYAVVRFHALVRLMSFGYYNVHAVFMAFTSLVGLVGIYRVFTSNFPLKWRPLFVLLFFLPSILFFGSGLHKEGLLIFCLGTILYTFDRLLTSPKSIGYWIYFLFCGLVLFALKEFYLAAFTPCLAGYLLCIKLKRKKLPAFAITVITFWILLFTAHHLLPIDNLAEKIAEKQSQFMVLEGNSFIEIPELDPSASNIIGHTPKSLLNVLFRPFPWEITEIRQLYYLLEVPFIFCLCLLLFIYPDRKALKSQPLTWLALVFSVTSFIIIGLIVPNLGAIARYKIPAFTFFIAFLVVGIRWRDFPILKRIFNH